MIIFLTNRLSNPRHAEELRLPLTFLGYGLVEMKMFKFARTKETFVLPTEDKWGNRVVYGTLYHLDDAHYYARLLDAYHVCSLSTLSRNHKKDLHHRINMKVTPISFTTLDEFVRLKYVEREPLDAYMYIGNIEHNKVSSRLHQTNSYRVSSGCDQQFATHLKEVFS